MIRRHDFNSDWWGADVGIVVDDSLFELPDTERAARLADWAWVEARGSLTPERCALVGAAGFFQVDTQVRFKIGLARNERLGSTPSLERLEVRTALETPFELAPEVLADFAHERFLALPGVTMERVNHRYASWSARLVAAAPGTSLAVLSGGRQEGWFLSREDRGGLELTLAMLREDAVISGHSLYHKALHTYAAQGVRVGHAAFSITNTAVLGIYSALGARFLAPEGCWLWHP